jgi:glycosyltransferase involved in cell wall biosynthesis
MVLEGSYPYITGGVSAWVHDLLTGLPDIEFALFTISPEENQKLRYTLPPNVVEHRDFVVSKPYRGGGKNVPLKTLLHAVMRAHRAMFSGAPPDIDGIIRLLPEGYSLAKPATKSRIGWDLITESNQRRNPIYAFTDYFWAWNSSHALLFRILAAPMPEADLYHAVSTGFAGLASYAAKVRKGKPLLLTEHGLYHKEREMEIRKTGMVRGYQRDMWISLYTQISRICYRGSDLVTALFEENRKKQLELGTPEEKTLVLPNGIDVERFAVERKKREGFHVGLVGRVVPIKDIKTFITAAKIVCAELPEARFYCIGPTDEDPGYYEDCRRLVESMKLTGQFEFTGRKNVLEYYSFLDVLVLTSVKEAQPLVILEAYRAGIPVVSTRVGNVAEMMDFDDRFIAASKDAVGIAKGILYIRRNPEEIKLLVERNIVKVLTHYDKKTLLERMRAVYTKLAAGEKSGGNRV